MVTKKNVLTEQDKAIGWKERLALKEQEKKDGKGKKSDAIEIESPIISETMESEKINSVSGTSVTPDAPTEEVVIKTKGKRGRKTNKVKATKKPKVKKAIKIKKAKKVKKVKKPKKEKKVKAPKGRKTY